MTVGIVTSGELVGPRVPIRTTVEQRFIIPNLLGPFLFPSSFSQGAFSKESKRTKEQEIIQAW